MQYTLLDTFLIDGYYVTQNYGSNKEYYSKFGLKGHEGVDFGHKNKLIKARSPISGTAFVGYDKNYGTFVVVEDYKQKCGVYLCHLTKPDVVSGQEIKAGDSVGEMHNTGNSTGEHVHLNFIILDEKGSKKYNSKQYNYGYLDPRYPRDTGEPIEFPGVETYSIKWVATQNENTMPDKKIVEITSEQFIEMRTKSDQSDALADYFGIKKEDLRAEHVISRYETVLKEKDEARNDANKKSDVLKETQSLLRTAIETSDARKIQYESLIEYFADKLGVPGDEAIIKGEFKELLEVEGELKSANKVIEQMKVDQNKKEDEFLEKINRVNEILDEKEKEITTLRKQMEDMRAELESIKETKESINAFNKTIQDIAVFFIRLKNKFKIEVEKEKND